MNGLKITSDLHDPPKGNRAGRLYILFYRGRAIPSVCPVHTLGTIENLCGFRLKKYFFLFRLARMWEHL